MRFAGTRRARGIILLLSLLAVLAIWRGSVLYLRRALGRLGPVLVRQAEAALHRQIRVRRLDVDHPGWVVARDVEVSRGRTFKDGTLLSAARVELTYNPALLAWGSLLWRGL